MENMQTNPTVTTGITVWVGNSTKSEKKKKQPPESHKNFKKDHWLISSHRRDFEHQLWQEQRTHTTLNTLSSPGRAPSTTKDVTHRKVLGTGVHIECGMSVEL